MLLTCQFTATNTLVHSVLISRTPSLGQAALGHEVDWIVAPAVPVPALFEALDLRPISLTQEDLQQSPWVQRLHNKSTSKPLRVHLEHAVCHRRCNDGDNIGPVRLRPKKQLKTVERAETNIGYHYWGLFGNPQPLCGFECCRLERLAAESLDRVSDIAHDLRIRIDNERFETRGRARTIA